MSKSSNHSPYGLLQPLAVPSRPWETIGIDFVGPLPMTQNGNQYMITMLDSRMFQVYAELLKAQTAEAATIAVCNIVGQYSKPSTVLTDNGQQFYPIIFKKS